MLTNLSFDYAFVPMGVLGSATHRVSLSYNLPGKAVRRGVAYVCVDALPTSEPILAKRGFEAVTYTQPFRWAD